MDLDADGNTFLEDEYVSDEEHSLSDNEDDLWWTSQPS